MDGAFAHWLEQHHLETVSCRDPFEACVYALTRPDACPDLILLGGDWLAPEEHVIVDYLRETWPGAAIILYGLGFSPNECKTRPGVSLFDTQAAVNRLLAEPPGAIIHALRETRPPARALPVTVELVKEMPPPEPVKLEIPRPAPQPAPRTKSAEMLGAELFAKPAPDAPKPIAPTTTHAILTQEELTALLEDDEK